MIEFKDMFDDGIDSSVADMMEFGGYVVTRSMFKPSVSRSDAAHAVRTLHHVRAYGISDVLETKLLRMLQVEIITPRKACESLLAACADDAAALRAALPADSTGDHDPSGWENSARRRTHDNLRGVFGTPMAAPGE